MSEIKLKALKARYTAQRLKAISELECAMASNHPEDNIDKLDSLVRQVDEAIRLSQTLDSIFKVEETPVNS